MQEETEIGYRAIFYEEARVLKRRGFFIFSRFLKRALHNYLFSSKINQFAGTKENGG
jgi:hypothetical protein